MNKSYKYYFFLIIDSVSIFFSIVLSYLIRHRTGIQFIPSIYKEISFVTIFIELLLFIFSDLFSDIVTRGYLEEFKKTFVHNLLLFTIVVCYLFTIKASSKYSRIVVFLAFILNFIFTYILRIMYKYYLRKKSLFSIEKGAKSLLVVCKKKDIDKVITDIHNNNYNFYRIAGICVIDFDLHNSIICGIKVVATKNNILDYISKNWVDEIYIFMEYKEIPKDIREGIILANIPTHVKIEDLNYYDTRPKIINRVGSYDTIYYSNSDRNVIQIAIKRIVDVLFAIVGCAFTFLLAIVIGPIIYIKSPGNIFYVSNRVGKNGKIFKFYKFRSMVLDAEEKKKELANENMMHDGMMFKIKNDPRIIPGIGSFIRKTSIDEFPQFFNVLKNDMSLVGTRPPTVDEWRKYTPYYRSRLAIKPGITGIWQVSGRSNITDFNEVVKLDNEYINNWSLTLDFKIILKTFINLFSSDKGAM